MIVSLSHPTITVNPEEGGDPLSRARPDSPRGGVSQEREALTMARMPAWGPRGVLGVRPI